MCNKTDCDKKASCQDKQVCTRCKVYLTFDKFKKKRDETYQVNCIECNLKSRIWKNENKCKHGKQKSSCKECGKDSFCEHDKRRSRCVDCKGGSVCEHDKVRSICKKCDGSSFCEHGKRRSVCKTCGGASLCEHGRGRTVCKECGGTSICQHKKVRTRCKQCGGGSICVHKIQRSSCKECNFGGYLRNIIANRCRDALKSNKSNSSIEYLGCNIQTFKDHIEAQFHPEMSWDNYGEWEIDHIVPIKYKKPSLEQQIARLHYTNTQPLWKDDNLSKGNQLIYGVLYNHDFHTEFKDCKN